MFGVLFLATVMAATPATSDPPLQRVFGIKLPAWGTTPTEIERAYSGAHRHEPHWCPNEVVDPTTRELKRPNVSVAGIPVQFVDFAQGPEGLDSITFDFGPGRWKKRGDMLLRHLNKRLGAPTEKRGMTTVWRRPSAFVIAMGTTIAVVRPGPRAEIQLETLDSLMPGMDGGDASPQSR